MIDDAYRASLVLWLVAPIALFMLHGRRQGLAGCFVLAYLASFIINHWFGAFVHASPWSEFTNSQETAVGFQYSTYGLIAFVVGAALPLARTQRQPRQEGTQADRAELTKLERYAARLFIPVGAAFWAASFTPLSDLPSAAATISAGKQVLVLGICQGCWAAWRLRARVRHLIWVGSASLLPLFTVFSAGFLSYGVVMATTILAFVGMYFRPRWPLLAVFAALLYGGLSLWVAYAQQRDFIRDAVWRGSGDRVAEITAVFKVIRPFDYTNPSHLAAVDLRLNQNALVGAAVAATPAMVPYRGGDTIWLGVVALVPRAIWPSKPVTAGSGNYVSQHTFIPFAEGTSVGMGQVLEFYINFGLNGILIGFFLLGLLLRWLDIKLVDGLRGGKWRQVLVYFLVGTAMLQNVGAVSEITGSIAGSLVLAFALSEVARWTLERRRRRGMQPRHGHLRS